MKKSSKVLVTLLFCLSIITATLLPTFAASVAKVSSVKATNVTYNSATITWSKVSKASGYQVEQYNASKKKWVQVGKDLKSSVTSLNVTKLTTGTTYKYRVRAFSKPLIGKTTYGAYSSTLSVKPLPAKPATIKATPKSQSVALSWSKVSGATGYYVQQYISKKWKTVSTVKTNSAEIKKLNINTTYAFRVAAYRTVGKSTFTGTYSATVKAKTALGQVQSLKYSSLKPASVKLSWKAVSEATGYYIKSYNASTKKWSVVAKTDAKTLSYTLKTTPNTSYKICVAAYKTISKKNYSGADSSSVSFKTTVAPATNAKIAQKTPTSATITWTKASNVSGYYVQQYVSKAWKTIKTITSASTASYTVGSLVPGTKYSFRVVSYYSSSKYCGKATSTVSITTTVAPATNLKISQSTPTSASLTWTGASGVSGYLVQQYVSKAWKTIKTITSASTASYTVGSLVPGTQYSFRVVSYYSKESYTGAATNTVSYKPTINPASGLKASSVTTNSLTLSWTAGKNLTGYYVQQNNGGTWKTIQTVKSNIVTTTITGLSAGTDYTFRICAYYDKYTANSSSLTVRTKTAVPTDISVTEKMNDDLYLVWTNGSAKVYKIDKQTGKLIEANDAETKTATTHSVVVKWNAVQGADGYDIYCTNKATGVETKIGSTASTTYTATELTATTSYAFSVEAYHNANGSTLSSGKSASSEITTLNTAVKSFKTTDTGTKNVYGQSGFKLSWIYIGKYNDNLYLIEKYNQETNEWTTLRDNLAVAQYTTYADNDVFDIDAKTEGIYTTVSWSQVKGAEGYIVQYSSNDENWIDVKEVTSDTLSTKIVLPADSDLSVRVAAIDGKFRISAYNEATGSDGNPVKIPVSKSYSLTTHYSNISKAASVKTTSIKDYSASSSEGKTLYTLKVVQAINNTKCETGTVQVNYKGDSNANVDKISLKGSLGILPIKIDFNNVESLIEYLNKIMGEESFDIDDLKGDLEEHISINGTANGGTIVYTDENNMLRSSSLKDVIIPYGEYAYLYESENVNDISKKISSVKVTDNTDGSQTVELKIAKETIKSANEKTVVHDGFMQGLSGFDIGGGSNEINLGESTIKAKINSDGTLDSLYSTSPYNISASFSVSEGNNSMNIGMAMSGTMVHDYTFTR